MQLNSMVNKALWGTLGGTIAGTAYFYLSESGVPKESNASYLSPISTDIIAWGFGALLIYKGYRYKDPTLSFIGSTVISIHISQFAAHKVIVNRGG